MPLVMDELLITPVPVDLRLWMQDVILGWKTIAEGQQWLAEHPETFTAKRIAALALVDGVVDAVASELLHEAYPRIVLCSRYRDVLLACLMEFHARHRLLVDNLYPGTREKKREMKLKRFHANRVPILGMQIRDCHDTRPLRLTASTEWLWIDRDPMPLFEAPGRTRVVHAK